MDLTVICMTHSASHGGCGQDPGQADPPFLHLQKAGRVSGGAQRPLSTSLLRQEGLSSQQVEVRGHLFLSGASWKCQTQGFPEPWHQGQEENQSTQGCAPKGPWPAQPGKYGKTRPFLCKRKRP